MIVHVSPAVMAMTGALLLLLLLLPLPTDALVRERGRQSDVRAKGMWAGGALRAGLTTSAVKFCNRSKIAAERLSM